MAHNISEQPLDPNFLRKHPRSYTEEPIAEDKIGGRNQMREKIAELIRELEKERKRSARWKACAKKCDEDADHYADMLSKWWSSAIGGKS